MKCINFIYLILTRIYIRLPEKVSRKLIFLQAFDKQNVLLKLFNSQNVEHQSYLIVTI